MRFQRLRNPFTALTLDEPRKLRQQILDLNLRLSDEESFMARYFAWNLLKTQLRRLGLH